MSQEKGESYTKGQKKKTGEQEDRERLLKRSLLIIPGVGYPVPSEQEGHLLLGSKVESQWGRGYHCQMSLSHL